jgi:hypothetical protein
MLIVPLLALLFPPAGAGASVPAQGGYTPIRGTLQREAPVRLIDPRGIELAGQIRQLDRRIDDLRESGQIGRREARAMRREARAIAHSWAAYGGDGLSDSEASELQSRLFVARSAPRAGLPASTAAR